MLEVTEERKTKVKQNHNSNLNHLPLPLPRTGRPITTIMRVIEVIIEAIDPIGANITVEGHSEGPSKGEGDNKIIIEANFKVIMGSLILFVVAIRIITMAIIEVEVAVAMVVTFIDHMAMGEAITEAITIINIINIKHMMMELNSNNTVYHAFFVEVSIILLNTVLKENMTLIILWRKEA